MSILLAPLEEPIAASLLFYLQASGSHASAPLDNERCGQCAPLASAKIEMSTAKSCKSR